MDLSGLCRWGRIEVKGGYFCFELKCRAVLDRIYGARVAARIRSRVSDVIDQAAFSALALEWLIAN